MSEVKTNKISSLASNNNITLEPDGTGVVNLADNDKLTFGTGSDLEIFHDGSNSNISDVGTGQLVLRTDGTQVAINKGSSENMAKFIVDGAVELYHDNSKKFVTASTGVDVTGKIEADNASNPALSGVTNRNTILQLQNTDTGYVAGNATAIDFGTSLTSATASIICKNDNAGSGYGGNLIFCTSPTSGNSLTQRVVIANDGSIFTDGISGSASAMANVKIDGNNELHKDTSARINKSEIADLHIGLDAVVALTPRKFKRGENTAFEIGFIADEMASVAPEVVMRGPKSWITSVETDTEEIDISIEYDKLTALLTKAIQELKTDLDAEKAKTTTLQTQVADLITRVAALEAGE